MTDSDGEGGAELRQRFKSEIENDFSDEKEIEAVLIDNESSEIIPETDSEKDSENGELEEQQEQEEEPKVTVCRGVRNLQPLQRPSFITRQFRNVSNFFSELLEFILLFLTTLFNPMADVNNQVQEHNQRRMAREGRYFSSTSKPKTTSFPGCGPSS